ncbi:MAG: 4Fe-4S binding protein, partial [Cetobacterium sp.]
HRINKDDCIGCGACESVCPVSCISEVEGGKREINENDCIDCGSCASVCPVSCISQA